MAAHAYRRSVEELDTGISRELVRVFTPFPPLPFLSPWSPGGIFSPPAFRSVNKADHHSRSAGRPLSHDHLRSPREDELVLPGDKRPHQQTE